MAQILAVIAIVAVYTVLLILLSSPSEPISVPLGKAQRAESKLRQKRSFEVPVRPSSDPPPMSNDRRLETVVEMAEHAWSSYMRAAAGADELRPLSNTSSNRWGGIGVTPVDSLDTLLLMNLRREFEEAKRLVSKIDMKRSSKPLSVFETIIRHVGGSLSAYALTNHTLFLTFARDTVDGLLHAFDGPLSFPAHSTRFGGTRDDNEYVGNKYMLAEFGSFQMELRFLAHLTGDRKYVALCDKVKDFLLGLSSRGWPSNPKLYDADQPIMPHKGLFPTFVTFEGKFFGAAGYAAMMDSFYEYLLKQWIQFGKKDAWLLTLYEDAVEGMLEYLLRYSENTNNAILGYLGHTFHPTMDHLACFTPGMLILGVMHGAHDYPNRNRPFSTEDVVAAATDIAATCYRFYAESPIGLAGDSAEFNLNGTYTVRYPKYILRPEVVESLFYLYRYTHDERYRDWGWNIAQAINLNARVPAGYTALDDITKSEIVGSDSMESFFIAETLKYLFLLFSDDSVLPLDEWVLTTEAHPLPILH